MTFGNIVYAAPHGAYLFLLAIPITAMLLYKRYCDTQSLKNFAKPNSLNIIASLPSEKERFFRMAAIILVWIAAVTAFMQPRGAGTTQHNKHAENNLLKKGRISDNDNRSRNYHAVYDTIFLLDSSASMAVTDTRVGISRLDYAKDIIATYCERAQGQSLALYSFTSEATVIVPLTIDALFFRLMLKKVTINEGDSAGTDIMEALDVIKEHHLEKIKRPTNLIIVTDGGDTRLEDLTEPKRNSEISTILDRISAIDNKNIRIFCVGMGSHAGASIPHISYHGKPVLSSLNEEFLSQIAVRGNGKYYFSNDLSPLFIANNIIDTVKNELLHTNEEMLLNRSSTTAIAKNSIPDYYDYYYQPPLALAILALFYTLHQRRRVQ